MGVGTVATIGAAALLMASMAIPASFIGGEFMPDLDEGDPDASEIFLCLHGEPSWSYLYRHVIESLGVRGLRVVAPDLVGYGRSDKPSRREDYGYQRQVDWLGAWLAANDLGGITLLGQDWGGLIGLRLLAEQPDRFARVVVSNTGLPAADGLRGMIAYPLARLMVTVTSR